MSEGRFWVFTAAGPGCRWSVAFGLTWNWVHVERRVDEMGDRLLLLSNLRRGALDQYFATAEAELRFWSISEEILDTAARDDPVDWRGFARFDGDPGEPTCSSCISTATPTRGRSTSWKTRVTVQATASCMRDCTRSPSCSYSSGVTTTSS